MTVLTEKKHSGEFILSEDDDGRLSRDYGVIASGAGVLLAGTVLGQKLVGAVTSAAKSGGNTGNGTLVPDATTPFVQAGARASEVGVYQVRFVTTTSVQIVDPRGNSVGTYAIGGSATNSVTISNHIKFVLTQGSTPFAAGDGFDVTVAAGSKKFVPSPASAYDGSDTAVACLIDTVDATSVDVNATLLTRHAEVNGSLLSYDASVSSAPLKAAKADQLKAQTIVVR